MSSSNDKQYALWLLVLPDHELSLYMISLYQKLICEDLQDVFGANHISLDADELAGASWYGYTPSS